MRADNLKLSIIFSLLAAFFYALIGTLIKISERSISNEMIVFCRQLIGLIVLSPLLILQGKSTVSLAPGSLHLHILRSISSLAAMYCLGFAVKYLPLTDALLLTYTRPLFIPIIVLLWFKKKWSRNTWFGLIIGFLGVALILKPDRHMFDIAAVVGLASALFGAIAFTCIRKQTKTDSANTILFYFFILSIPLSMLPLFKHWVMPTSKEWGLLAVIGIFGMIYQMTLTRAYQYAKAFKVASMLYSTIIFAAFFDWWLGDFSIDSIGILGIICIIIGTIITIKQKVTPFPPENQKKKETKDII